jgi:hypothetical protein
LQISVDSIGAKYQRSYQGVNVDRPAVGRVVQLNTAELAPAPENGVRLPALSPEEQGVFSGGALQLYLTGLAGAADGHLADRLGYPHAGIAVPALTIGVEVEIPALVEEDIEMIVAVLEVLVIGHAPASVTNPVGETVRAGHPGAPGESLDFNGSATCIDGSDTAAGQPGGRGCERGEARAGGAQVDRTASS